ncbi:hypothetical protein JNUCC64_31775 [Streptomyces sp. JNUCC 64]
MSASGSDGGPPSRDRFQGGYAVRPGPGSSPSFHQYVASARSGALDALHVLGTGATASVPGEVLEALGYRLLLVAADSGNAEAGELVEGVLANSPLFRHDDDRSARGDAHFELGLAYLRGSDGLPVDPGRGVTHLETARACRWPGSGPEGEALFAAARALLTAPQLTLFDRVYRPR